MYIKVKVITRAKKFEITKVGENCLKVKLRSPPIQNKANSELIRLLASYYSVKKSAIKIVDGKKCREKLVEILLG